MSLSAYTPDFYTQKPMLGDLMMAPALLKEAEEKLARINDPQPTVLTRSNITRLGLQNHVARRLRTHGCRVLQCSALSEATLSIRIMPPPTHHRLRLAPTLVRRPGQEHYYQCMVDGVAVIWMAADDQRVEASHAA